MASCFQTLTFSLFFLFNTRQLVTNLRQLPPLRRARTLPLPVALPSLPQQLLLAPPPTLLS
jgi:hypothetical protein